MGFNIDNARRLEAGFGGIGRNADAYSAIANIYNASRGGSIQEIGVRFQFTAFHVD